MHYKRDLVGKAKATNMVKIIKPGVAWWDGIVLHCIACDRIIQLEASDPAPDTWLSDESLDNPTAYHWCVLCDKKQLHERLPRP